MFGFLRKRSEKRGSNPNSRANLQQGPPSPGPVNVIKTETAKVNSVSDLVDSVTALNEKLGLLRPGEEEGEELLGGEFSWLAAYAPYVGPFIGPYIPSLLEKLGIQPQGTTTPQPTEPVVAPNTTAGPVNIAQLIPAAAAAPESVLKTFMPQLRNELKAQGVDEKQFKAACIKIGKVL